jgi:GT2 family glycosyltransferase
MSRLQHREEASAVPTWVGEVELSAPLGAVPIVARAERAYERARILVRLHGEPLGFLDVPIREGWNSPEGIAAALEDQLDGPIRQHLADDGLPVTTLPAVEVSAACAMRSGGWHEPFSVVVCTRDRPEHLARCLPQLQQLSYDAFDVLVVDNASRGSVTVDVFDEIVGDDERFRVVREPKPGLSHARNRALDEVRHEFVAFTDDDVLVDGQWLDGLARGFGRTSAVACVTGLVPSASLDGPVEQYFDRRAAWSSSLEAEVFDIAHPPTGARLFPFAAGGFGTGANFAVRREVMRDLGGFDAALGVGSPAGGGEDLDAFVRILRASWHLAYEPSALVWHLHRSDLADLHSQLFGYGRGLSAYLTKYIIDAQSRRQIIARAPSGAVHALGLLRRGDAPAARKRLVFAEVAGMLGGPIAYGKGRHSLKRLGMADQA